MRRSALLCFWQIVSWTARFLHVKTKAYKNAFYHMYVCPTSAHLGFRYGYRRYKGNTFTLKTTLFGWQNMILRSDLTLLNINMSKNSTFAWFFLPKSLYQSMIIRIFAASVLAKPLNNAQIVRGVFCLYTFEYGESYSLYKTIWIFRKSR